MPNEIAAELDCHPQTVRIHLKRFNAVGIAGLGMRPGSGRKPRITEQQRSRILALAKQEPPGHLSARADGTMVARDEEGSAQWTLNATSQATQEVGIQIKRSQIRRIYVREGVRWRHPHSWGDSNDPDFVPKEPRSSVTIPSHPRGRRPSVPTRLGPVVPRTFAPAPGWSASGHRIKAPLDYSRGPEKIWVYGADAACAMARSSPDVPPRATPPTTSPCFPTSKPTIRQATSDDRLATFPATTVLRLVPGWLSIRGSITSSFRKEPVG